MPKLRVYVKNLSFISPFPLMFEPCRNREILCMALSFLSGYTTFDPVKSQILDNKYLPSLSKVFDRLQQASLSDSNIVTSPSSK